MSTNPLWYLDNAYVIASDTRVFLTAIQRPHPKSDPGDAFNNFWRIMEGMLDNLSQPVAFATAPLGTEPGLSGKRGVQRDGSSGSETERDPPFTSRFSRKLGFDGRSTWVSCNISNPPYVIGAEQNIVLEETDEEVFAEEGKPATNKIRSIPTSWTTGGDLSESFCLIPLESEPATSALQKQNVSLRQEIEETQRRLAEAERSLQLRKEQDQLLRDSIVMARHQVGFSRWYHLHTVNLSQAQRAMGASLVLQRPGGQQPAVDLGALNINIPSIPTPMAALNTGRDREAQHLRRIRDLEEELRVARVENDKQVRSDCNKFACCLTPKCTESHDCTLP